MVVVRRREEEEGGENKGREKERKSGAAGKEGSMAEGGFYLVQCKRSTVWQNKKTEKRRGRSKDGNG